MSDPWGTAEVGRTDPVTRREPVTRPDPVAPPPGPTGPPGVFHRGVAQVGVPRPRVEEPPPPYPEPAPARPWDSARPPLRTPLRPVFRQLRIGGEWTSIGVLFAFVCWGIWAISSRGNDLGGLLLTFFLVLVIAAGLFTLLRLLGRVVLERSLGRVRRGARGAHLATGLFLAAAGIAYLGKTPWVVDAWTWLGHLLW